MAAGLSLSFRRGTGLILLRSNRSKLANLYSTMSRLLIDESKYSWLRDLGLKADNPGVFYGAWGGQGQVSTGQQLVAVVFFIAACRETLRLSFNVTLEMNNLLLTLLLIADVDYLQR